MELLTATLNKIISYHFLLIYLFIYYIIYLFIGRGKPWTIIMK